MLLSPPSAALHGRDAAPLAQVIGLLARGGDLAAGRPPGAVASGADSLRRAHPDADIAGDIAATLGLPAAVEQALRTDAAPPVSTSDFLPVSASLTLVADVAELQLPWLAGHARRVAALAYRAGASVGLDDDQQTLLVRAALLHGIGRVAVPATVWARKGKLDAAGRDAVRRAPYWSARVGADSPGLAAELQLASQVYERLDGSGYYRGLDADALGMPQRLLAISAAFVALCAPRPWRAPHAPAAARALLEAQASAGRLDRAALAAVVDAAASEDVHAPGPGPLSARETDVLRRISLGDSERDAARALRLSVAAIHTHLDSILLTLGCATRPAATLRALTLNLI